MARSLSQTLIRTTTSTTQPSPLSSLVHGNKSSNPLAFSFPLGHRHRSNQSGKAQLIEVDLESDGEVEVLGIRKLEDVIHNIIVKRSAPDWLPFIPGSSYWVPPRRRASSSSVADLIGKLTNPLNEEETMSLTTVRGWPSSAYFVEGTSSAQPVPIQTVEEVKVLKEPGTENASQSEEEEG